MNMKDWLGDSGGKKLTELEEAEMRHEAREMYNDIGLEGCLACLNESNTFNLVLISVILEEMGMEGTESR